MPVYTSRAQKILALVPKCNIPSDIEDDSCDEVVSEEHLEAGIDDFFEYLQEDFNEFWQESHITSSTTGLFENVEIGNQKQPVSEEVDMLLDGEMEEDVTISESAPHHYPDTTFPGKSTVATSQEDEQTNFVHIHGLSKTNDLQPGTSPQHGSNKKKIHHNAAKQKKGFKPKKRPRRGNLTKKATNKHRETFNWQRGVPFLHEVSEMIRAGSTSNATTSKKPSIREPIEYFLQLFNEDLIDDIIFQSNLFATQKQLAAKKNPKKGSNLLLSTKSFVIDKYDFYDYLAIEIFTGIVQFPSIDDPWSGNLRFDPVAGIMPVKKFKTIRRYLHFNNNDDQPSDDPYFKVRPLLENLRQSFQKIPDEEKYSIDEMMVPYKGTRAGSRRQYMKDKPIKWGIKMFVRSGVSGIIYDFLIYGGPKTFDGVSFTSREQKFGVSAQAVLALCKTISIPQLKLIFFDNYYSSPGLMSYLRDEYGLLALGTFRTNRFPGINFMDDKKLKKKGRGSFDTLVENKKKLVVVKWMDNKAVHLVSNYCGAGNTSDVMRWSKEEKKHIPVARPGIIAQYNECMGGVDLSGQLVSFYRTKKKSRKWYLSIWYQLLDTAINNSWLMYRRDFTAQQDLQGDSSTDEEVDEKKKKMMSLKDFRILLAQQLHHYNRRPRSRPADNSPGNRQKKAKKDTGKTTPPKPGKMMKCKRKQEPKHSIPYSLRFDMVAHFPEVTTKGRCRMCGEGRTTWQCSKCKLRLCLKNERVCFSVFHQSSSTF